MDGTALTTTLPLTRLVRSSVGMGLGDASNLRAACLAILAELEREFLSVRTFTELRRSTGLSQSEVEAALAELNSRRLVAKGLMGKRHGYFRIYVSNAKPFA